MQNPNPHARLSFMQQAQANIKQFLMEQCCEKEYFRSLNILTSDTGTILDEIDEALKTLGLAVSIEVTGGKVPVVDDTNASWNCSIFVTENPILNRSETGTGKTADTTVDAILRATCIGPSYFVPEEVVVSVIPGLVAYEIRGTTGIILKSKPCFYGKEKASES